MEPPNPTLLIQGIAIPTDDIELIFDDDIIPGYVADNEAANLGDQEPAFAGYQEPANDRHQTRAQELPNSDKFSKITRPLIAANRDTLARKLKLNKSKPRDKVEVSKTVIKL